MRSATITLTAISALASFFIAYFVVPDDLKLPFGLLALICVIVGYPSGNLASGKLRRSGRRILCLSIGGIVCAGLVIAYAVRVQMVSADTSDIVILALIIAAFFLRFRSYCQLPEFLRSNRKIETGESSVVMFNLVRCWRRSAGPHRA